MNISDTKKEYKSTATMVYSCQYHIIFTTKYRRKVLSDIIQVRLKELIKEKQEDYGYEIIELEIMYDHVHLLLDINPQYGVYKVIGNIKGYSSKVLRDEFPELKKRLPTLWTRSKFISTVGSVSLEVVKKYIEDQKNK
jgi:putative transposase